MSYPCQDVICRVHSEHSGKRQPIVQMPTLHEELKKVIVATANTSFQGQYGMILDYLPALVLP
jgi:hypothetical protein